VTDAAAPAGGQAEEAALAALDPDLLVADLQEFVRIPSPTGLECEALTWLAGRAAHEGLDADLHQHDLAELRVHPAHPGEEAPREELWNLTASLPGRDGPGRLPRLALCGHVDVVGPGTVPWRHGGPYSATVQDGWMYGRGTADMKAGVIAALHALAAVRRGLGAAPGCAPALLAVSGEEDGGLGAFAALERDPAWDACIVTEPTAFDLVCAQAGALTFTGTVRGVAAHAAHRLEGASAIDRYVPIHQALHALEADLNADVAHPLMRDLALPYPVLVGRVEAGLWSSQVPDRLEFEGRAPVRVGEDVGAARHLVQAAVDAAVATGDPPVELTWDGGQFASGQTPPDAPVVRAVAGAVEEELGRPPRLAGVPWGADMRLFCDRGIPTVMVGTAGIERAHGVDERVSLAELVALTRALIRVLCRYGSRTR
jgi:acetylornithine deacetylase